MNISSFQAVFENGVLRPLEPLALPEHEIVSLTIVPAGVAPSPPADESEEAARQADAWRKLLAELEQIPDAPDPDGLTNRDHDQILYGKRPGDLR
jgi:predicted DNA-binding antitoxin AbrB/MazE fold protein